MWIKLTVRWKGRLIGTFVYLKWPYAVCKESLKVDFLRLLADSQLGLGCVGSAPMVSVRLWMKVCGMWETLSL